jgi:hypothetical protein
MSWLHTQVSYYRTHADNIGVVVTFDQIFYLRLKESIDTIEKIFQLRNLDKNAVDYKQRKLELKAQLPCFTPAAILQSKAKGSLIEIERTGIMQLDFDKDVCDQYDIEELKHCVFSLPFVAYCGLSCSGDGFFAMALIAEPQRLYEYADHCFKVFESYGIKPDTSKGKRIENLRYVSYDANMLIKDDPQPLRIIPKSIQSSKKALNKNKTLFKDSLLNHGLLQISNAQVGQRWETVQRVAYTIGGTCNNNYLDEIKNAINNNSSFNGEEIKYFKCAEDCFREGTTKPLQKLN